MLFLLIGIRENQITPVEKKIALTFWALIISIGMTIGVTCCSLTSSQNWILSEENSKENEPCAILRLFLFDKW